MIILSQDNEKVRKRIINFNNIIYLGIDRPGLNDYVIIFKDNTMDDNKLKDYNCLLGIYDTEERAKEVLQEIIKEYREYRTAECDGYTNILQETAVYEMPVK